MGPEDPDTDEDLSDEEVKNSLLDLWQQSKENKQVKTVIQDLLGARAIEVEEKEEKSEQDIQDLLRGFGVFGENVLKMPQEEREQLYNNIIQDQLRGARRNST